MTANYFNNCGYCIAAHSAIAKASKVQDEIIEFLRDNKPLDEPKLEKLRTFTRIVVEKRGFASPEEIESFLSAGYAKEQLMEVIVDVSHKVMSN